MGHGNAVKLSVIVIWQVIVWEVERVTGNPRGSRQSFLSDFEISQRAFNGANLRESLRFHYHYHSHSSSGGLYRIAPITPLRHVTSPTDGVLQHEFTAPSKLDPTGLPCFLLPSVGIARSSHNSLSRFQERTDDTLGYLSCHLRGFSQELAGLALSLRSRHH